MSDDPILALMRDIASTSKSAADRAADAAVTDAINAEDERRGKRHLRLVEGGGEA